MDSKNKKIIELFSRNIEPSMLQLLQLHESWRTNPKMVQLSRHTWYSLAAVSLTPLPTPYDGLKSTFGLYILNVPVVWFLEESK